MDEGVDRPPPAGGAIAFQDVVLTTRATQPPVPLVAASNGWLVTALRRLGRPVDMGLRLAAVFTAAGLPDPLLTAGAPLERGGGAVGLSIIAGDATTLLPVYERTYERTGVATTDEVGVETVEQRLREQADAADAVLVNPLLMGAAARVADGPGLTVPGAAASMTQVTPTGGRRAP
jgi:hypothetical protein